jgi:hypothetical protein
MEKKNWKKMFEEIKTYAKEIEKKYRINSMGIK